MELELEAVVAKLKDDTLRRKVESSQTQPDPWSTSIDSDGSNRPTKITISSIIKVVVSFD